MATATLTKPAAKGGSFLLESPQPSDVFTPADLTDDQKLIGQTAEEFVLKEVFPFIKDLENKKPGLMAELVKKGGEVGLMGGGVPEEFGGAGLDKISTTVLTEKLSIYGGFAVTHGAHAGIGTLPIVYFGTEAQKKKYLPKLATGEWIGAYCLSEPQAGSDAQNSLTRAELNAEGTHYILNGQKMWITNGGFADVYIVFAKVGGEKFTAFIVERTPGKLQSAQGKPAARNRARAHCGVQYPECWALHARCFRRRRLEARAHDLREVLQRAQSVREANWRFRFDEGKTGGDGHSDFRRGIDGVPLGGKHRGGHGRGFRLWRQNPEHHESA